MIRFPNPGSNLDNMAEIFVVLFNDLSSRDTFNLDDMSASMVRHNLAASCGRMGEEALRRSSRSDRSRDPLYNQSKMYSEVYRSLGWITSLEDSRLTFQFTLLGAHVSAAAGTIGKLMKECFLGIAFPNPMLDIKNEVSLRPFKSFLLAMRELDGYISRDELIYGPMHLHDDRDADEFASMIKEIKECRSHRGLNAKLRSKLRMRNIKYTTAGNYTRFPLAVLKWAGWAERVFKRVYDKSEPFYQLTSEGYSQISSVEKLNDFRRDDLENIPSRLRGYFISSCFYGMLDRCGFNTAPLTGELDKAKEELLKINIDVSNILFSPLQELTPSEVAQYNSISPIFNGQSSAREEDETTITTKGFPDKRRNADAFGVVLIDSKQEVVRSELDEAWSRARHDMTSAINFFVEEHSHDNKEVFYPLVARLFSLSGFPCEASRNGVNYQRADATITLKNGLLIPIEIKSPGEEVFISVKAVRQAVENRIILLSRQPNQSRRNLTSLVVGFSYPNDRAEVNELLHDFHNAFGFNIGIISFPLLVKMAFAAVYGGKTLAVSDMENSHGFFSIHS